MTIQRTTGITTSRVISVDWCSDRTTSSWHAGTLAADTSIHSTQTVNHFARNLSNRRRNHTDVCGSKPETNSNVFQPTTRRLLLCRLTLSPPIPLRLYTLPYWSNPPFLISDIRALWRSGLSARAPECQKLKSGGLDQYGAGPFKKQQSRTAGVEGVNNSMSQTVSLAYMTRIFFT